MKNNRIKSTILLFVLGISVTLLVGFLIKLGIVDEYIAQILTNCGIAVIMAMSLNLISGFTGQLSLGQAGFMAIGAYTAAVCSMTFGLPIIISIIIGGIVTALMGALIGIPTLKLKGDYLAIVTLGFGEIIRVVMINLETLTGGAAGLKGVPTFTKDILAQPTAAFMWVTAVMLIIIAVVSNMINSSYGRAIISIREDEIASSSMGVRVYGYKLLAFTCASFIAGIGGALYAFVFNYLNPTMFNIMKSVDYLIILVFGGMGSVTGTVVAGFGLTYLQEALRFLQDYRMVIYPVILILVMIFVPSGLLGNREFSVPQFLKNSPLRKPREAFKAALKKDLGVKVKSEGGEDGK